MEHIFTEQHVDWKYYHGVRVFLDFMIIDTAKEWCNIVENQRQNPNRNTFPIRLQKLNADLKKYAYSDPTNLANFLKGSDNLKKYLINGMLFNFDLKTHELRNGSSTTNLESTTNIAP